MDWRNFNDVKILEILAHSGVSLEHFLELLPTYYSYYDKIEIKEDKKDQIIQAFDALITSKKFPGEMNRVIIDGYRINFSNGWLLIRPSGTEPKIRIMSDSSDDNFAKNLLKQGKDLVIGLIQKF